MSRTIIFGPPGTGKTTKLLGLMEQEMERGVEPERIAFVSFTRSAVREASSRAQSKFNFTPPRLRWFRTLHSLAFTALGLSRDSVMADLAAFAEANGFSINKKVSGIEAVFAERKGDELLPHAKSLCDATGLPLREVAKLWRLEVSEHRYETFCSRLAEWKRSKDLMDYADMIAHFTAQDTPIDAEVAFIDEAQDLTPRQWAMVECAFRNAKRIYIAGDDDQAIYSWAGADVNRLLTMPAEHIVLNQSHRIPSTVHALANRISGRIANRKAKVWSPRDAAGIVGSNAVLNALPVDNGESWMLLARTGMTLPTLSRSMEQRGIPYRYNGEDALGARDRENFATLLALRNGDFVSSTAAKKLIAQSSLPITTRFLKAHVVAADIPHLDRDEVMMAKVPAHRRRFLVRLAGRGMLMAEPKVDVSTIHHAKGAEAHNVALSPDLTLSTATALRNTNYSDSEHRVMYVGATRAQQRLFLLRPGAEHTYGFGG